MTGTVDEEFARVWFAMARLHPGDSARVYVVAALLQDGRRDLADAVQALERRPLGQVVEAADWDLIPQAAARLEYNEGIAWGCMLWHLADAGDREHFDKGVDALRRRVAH